MAILLNSCPKEVEMHIQTKTYTQMLLAALFVVANEQKCSNGQQVMDR
jgi:hypothetical protein